MKKLFSYNYLKRFCFLSSSSPYEKAIHRNPLQNKSCLELHAQQGIHNPSHNKMCLEWHVQPNENETYYRSLGECLLSKIKVNQLILSNLIPCLLFDFKYLKTVSPSLNLRLSYKSYRNT